MKIILDSIGVHYKMQHRVGNYPVDFYLPNFKLSIQCDGCYFHQHSSKLCKVTKVPRQIFQKYRDKACIAYHKYKHINIIRFYGCEILAKPDIVRDTILSTISKIKNGDFVYGKL